MKLFLSEPRGFCAGVVRAIDTVEAALKKWGAPIYVKHNIVHNSHVVDLLKHKGAIFIEDLNTVPRGSILIYSAHGVSPKVRALAKSRQLREIDATCGLVTRIHSTVKRFAKKKYHILLIGHKNHVEIIGTKDEAPEATTVVETVEDVHLLTFKTNQKLFYVTQTTLSLYDIQDIVEAIKIKFPQIETLPTSSICYATTNRQMALRSICSDVELVLVVGDCESSNSNRLVEVAKNNNLQAYLIDSSSKIQESWLKDIRSVGLTAGASTPEWVVEECIEKLKQIGVFEINKVSSIEEDVFFQLPAEVLED